MPPGFRPLNCVAKRLKYFRSEGVCDAIRKPDTNIPVRFYELHSFHARLLYLSLRRLSNFARDAGEPVVAAWCAGEKAADWHIF